MNCSTCAWVESVIGDAHAQSRDTKVLRGAD